MIICATIYGYFEKDKLTDAITFHHYEKDKLINFISVDYLLPVEHRPMLEIDKFTYSVYSIINDYYIIIVGGLCVNIHKDDNSIKMSYTDVNLNIIDDI